MFNIYLNDLFFFPDYTEASKYADATDLYACDIDLENLIYRLEHDAHISIEWFESNYMKLNEDKCQFLISGNKNEHLFVNVGLPKISSKYQVIYRLKGNVMPINILISSRGQNEQIKR